MLICYTMCTFEREINIPIYMYMYLYILSEQESMLQHLGDLF